MRRTEQRQGLTRFKLGDASAWARTPPPSASYTADLGGRAGGRDVTDAVIRLSAATTGEGPAPRASPSQTPCRSNQRR